MDFGTAKEAIKSRIDLVDLIGETVRLKRSGRSFKGLCPFHDEKTPSFHVFPDTGTFRCFGCQKGGDHFTWIMETERVEFPEALRMLAERAGVPLPRARGGGHPGRRRALLEVLAAVQNFFVESLRGQTGARAREYLAHRRLEDAVAPFGLGYAPPPPAGGGTHPLVSFFRARRLPAEAGVALGLLGRRPDGSLFDRFRARIMFPIHDERGRIVGYGGRILPGFESEREPKYLNSPESPVFNKRRILYGLHQVRRAARGGRLPGLIVMEGYTDVVAAHLGGFRGAVATLGTSLTEEHARLLRRFSDDEAVLVFDGDRAGRRAAERAFASLAAALVPARIALLPEGSDPADLIARGAAEAFRAVLAGARPALEVWLELTTGGLAMDRPEGRAEAVQRCRSLLAAVPDPAHRDLLRADLARRLFLDPALLAVQPARRPAGVPPGPGKPSAAARDPEERARRTVLAAVGRQPRIWAELRDRVRIEEFFPDPRQRKLLEETFELLVATEGGLESRRLWEAWWNAVGEEPEGRDLLLALQDLASTLADPAAAASDGVSFLESKSLKRAVLRLKEGVRRAHLAGDAERAAALERELFALLRRSGKA